MKKLKGMLIAISLIMVFGLTLAGCSVQQNQNIASITVIEKTIPKVIEVGAFDAAEIKAMITYKDGSTSDITIKSNMLSQEDQAKLTTPGNYCVQIIFKDVTTEIFITIVEPVVTYTVTFYDPYGDKISSQEVISGEDATAPTEFDWNCDFVAWDRLFTNVTEDIDVYAIGSYCRTCPLPLNVVFYASDSKYGVYDIVSFDNGKVKYFSTSDKDITKDTIKNSSAEYVYYDLAIQDGNWVISFKSAENNQYTYSIEFSTSLKTVETITFNQNDTQQSQKTLVVHPISA